MELNKSYLSGLNFNSNSEISVLELNNINLINTLIIKKTLDIIEQDISDINKEREESIIKAEDEIKKITGILENTKIIQDNKIKETIYQGKQNIENLFKNTDIINLFKNNRELFNKILINQLNGDKPENCKLINGVIIGEFNNTAKREIDNDKGIFYIKNNKLKYLYIGDFSNKLENIYQISVNNNQEVRGILGIQCYGNNYIGYFNEKGLIKNIGDHEIEKIDSCNIVNNGDIIGSFISKADGKYHIFEGENTINSEISSYNYSKIIHTDKGLAGITKTNPPFGKIFQGDKIIDKIENREVYEIHNIFNINGELAGIIENNTDSINQLVSLFKGDKIIFEEEIRSIGGLYINDKKMSEYYKMLGGTNLYEIAFSDNMKYCKNYYK